MYYLMARMCRTNNIFNLTKGASMKKYRVTARSVGHVEIFVDAKNKKEALAKAEKIDGFDWEEYSSHWQILEAEEAEEETKP